MKILRVLLLTSFVAGLLVFAQAASAADRFASPSGSGSTCSLASPCSLTTAINSNPSAANEVYVLAGTYGSPGSPITGLGGSAVPSNQKIHGVTGPDRPTIYVGGTWGLQMSHGLVEDLNITIDGSSTLYGITSFQGTLRRLRVVGSASSAVCDALANISDSVCVNTMPLGGTAIGNFVSTSMTDPPIEYAVTHRNVLGWAIGSIAGYGLETASNDYSAAKITAINSIYRGSSADIRATSNGVGGASIRVEADYSNFRTVSLDGPGSVTPAGSAHNQTAEPIFANAASLDFHPVPGSPTVDLGLDDASGSTLDLDGSPRPQGYRRDVGPYESPFFGPVDPWPASAPPPTAPSLSGFKLSKKKYKAARSGKSFQPSANAKRKSNKGRGTVVSFKLSGEGSVHFRIFKRVEKNGKKTWKYLKGVETVAGLPGTNKFWFSGRWKGKTLPAGTYLLKGTPTVKGSTIKNTSGDEPGTSKGLASSIVKK